MIIMSQKSNNIHLHHTIWRTTILGYPTILNFTYLIQLLTMSLRCLLCFFRELFAIYNEKCPFALNKFATINTRLTLSC